MSRLREKLAKILVRELKAQFDIDAAVSADDLDPAQGFYRTSPHADCYRWEGSGKVVGTNLSISFYGNTTMTNIVRSGSCQFTRDAAFSFDVFDAKGN